MPDPIDKPSLLAAVSRLRRYVPCGDKSFVIWDTDDSSAGWAQAYRHRDADRATLASALLALMPAEEEPKARKWTERMEVGVSLAWFLSCEGISHERCPCGLCSLGGVGDYRTESAARLALQWQSFWRHWEVMGLGKGEGV